MVGSGPNGLVAAVTLAHAGWQVTVIEAAARPGGGTRSEALTLPGFVHDVCSAVHPLGVASSALSSLPLGEHGLQWVEPEVQLAHPLDSGRAALLFRSVDTTAAALGPDATTYQNLLGPLTRDAHKILPAVLRERMIPRPSAALARFALTGCRGSSALARRFSTAEARGLVAGLAAHSILPLTAPLTAGYGLALGMLAHTAGWPVARGGSQAIAAALVAELEANDGELVLETPVRSLADLDEFGPRRAVLLDVTPRQVVGMVGDLLPERYRRRLERFRYGPGVFKLDWALDGPIPWLAPQCGRAATVHVGGTYEEVAAAEADVASGKHPTRPFVLLAQPTVADPSRAPEGRHTAWAYCHVPNGSDVDMTEAVEAQLERFAPGFRERVLARRSMATSELAAYNENYVGGDINGGAADWWQLFARPVPSLVPWATPVRGLYLCSSSTPPGGGVHGMCGWNAARTVLRRER